MSDAITGMKQFFGKATPAGTVIESPTPQVTSSNVPASNIKVVNNADVKVAQAGMSQATKEMLMRTGTTALVGAVTNRMNRPKDAREEMLKAKVASQRDAAEAADKQATAKRKGGYGSTISANSKVGGSTLAN